MIVLTEFVCLEIVSEFRVQRSDWGRSLSVQAEGCVSLIGVRQQQHGEERRDGLEVSLLNKYKISKKKSRVKLFFTAQRQK